MRKSYSLIITVFIIFISCNKVGLIGRDDWLIGSNVDSFIQGQSTGSLNLIWVIDDSGSMKGDQESLSENFEIFIDNFINTNISYKMGITTTDMTHKGARGEFIVGSGADPDSRVLTSRDAVSYVIENFKINIMPGTSGSGHEKGLSAALAAIKASDDSSSHSYGFIEHNSHVAVVIVSDEDEDAQSNTTTSQFNKIIDDLRNFKDSHGQRLSIYPIINSTPVPRCSNSSQERQGKNYIKAVEELGGEVFDKCDNFGESLDFLGKEMVVMLKRFILSKIPIPESIKVGVNGKIVKTGWTYDEIKNCVEFDKEPPDGARIDIVYETNLGRY